MKAKRRTIFQTGLALALVSLSVSGPVGVPTSLADEPAPASVVVDLPAGVRDVIELTKANLNEDLIVAKIRKVGTSYDLSPKQIIYLTNLGVSQNIIAALLQPAAPVASPPEPPANPPVNPPATPLANPPVNVTVNATVNPADSGLKASAVPAGTGNPDPSASATSQPQGGPPATFDSFRDQLSAYGTWEEQPGYGWCWRPFNMADGWRPYSDGGRWVDTDAGMYWQSEYAWGTIAFHYGRWIYQNGWTWVPAYEYAPAWVSWRYSGDNVGWAPLPYGAVWIAGGWEYNHVRVGVDFDFGLGASFYVFVGGGHLWEHDYHGYVLHGDDFHRAFRESAIARARFDEHGHFIHEGLRHDELERLTHQKVTEVRHDELVRHDRVAAQKDYRQTVGTAHDKPDQRSGMSGQTERNGQSQPHTQPGQRGQTEQYGQSEEHERGQTPQRGQADDKGKSDSKSQNQSKDNNNQRPTQSN
jgi:hypothetical protein